jgi:hypothetical protein
MLRMHGYTRFDCFTITQTTMTTSTEAGDGEKIFAISQIVTRLALAFVCATNINREKARKHVVVDGTDERAELAGGAGACLVFRSLFSGALAERHFRLLLEREQPFRRFIDFIIVAIRARCF